MENGTDLFCLYTIGYACWMPNQVMSMLDRFGAVLVDIRLNPVTTKPGFSKADLQRKFGGRYHWCQDLGNTAYKDGDIQIRDINTGIEYIEKLLHLSPVVLMCGCKDVQHCHRRVAALDIREEIGVDVRHLNAWEML